MPLSFSLKLLQFHYILQLVLISTLLLFSKLYFEDVNTYQNFKIMINEKALNDFHRDFGDNFGYAEYLNGLISPLPQQKYNDGKADYLNLLKDYFLFLKDDYNVENYASLSSVNKKIHKNSEIDFVQLVLSSYKKDFINFIVVDDELEESDFQNFLTETSELYKQYILDKQLSINNKINEKYISEQKNFDLQNIKELIKKNPKYFDLLNIDLEMLSNFFNYEKLKFQILLFNSFMKNKEFIDNFDKYIRDLNLFKIEDLKIKSFGANKKILAIAMLLLLFLIFYLELKKWKKKTTTLF